MNDTSTPTVPDDIDTQIEHDDGDGAALYVSCHVAAGGQEFGAAHTVYDGEPSDAQIADSLLRVVQAAAGCHSSGVWMEVQRRIGGAM